MDKKETEGDCMSEINIEKDHLVITKKLDGAYKGFAWYPEAKGTVAEIEALIVERNSKEIESGCEHATIFELIADRLVREICSYGQRSKSAEALIEQAKNAFDSIKSAMRTIKESKDHLADAEKILDEIKGLE